MNESILNEIFLYRQLLERALKYKEDKISVRVFRTGKFKETRYNLIKEE